MVGTEDSKVDALFWGDSSSSKLFDELTKQVACLFDVVGSLSGQTFLYDLNAHKFGTAKLCCVHVGFFDQGLHLDIANLVAQEGSIGYEGSLGDVFAVLSHADESLHRFLH